MFSCSTVLFLLSVNKTWRQSKVSNFPNSEAKYWPYRPWSFSTNQWIWSLMVVSMKNHQEFLLTREVLHPTSISTMSNTLSNKSAKIQFFTISGFCSTTDTHMCFKCYYYFFRETLYLTKVSIKVFAILKRNSKMSTWSTLVNVLICSLLLYSGKEFLSFFLSHNSINCFFLSF